MEFYTYIRYIRYVQSITSCNSLRVPIRASSHFSNFHATLFCTNSTTGYFLLNSLHVVVETFRAASNSFYSV